VHAKGRDYYFFQAHRGTLKEGPRIPLPRDPRSGAFWDRCRELAGTVPGYSGTVAEMIDDYLKSVEFVGNRNVKGKSASTQRTYRLYLGHSRGAFGQLAPDAVKPMYVMTLRQQFEQTPGAANMIIKALGAVYKWARPLGKATVNPCDRLPMFKSEEHEPWPRHLIDLVLANARWEIRPSS